MLSCSVVIFEGIVKRTKFCKGAGCKESKGGTIDSSYVLRNWTHRTNTTHRFWVNYRLSSLLAGQHPRHQIWLRLTAHSTHSPKKTTPARTREATPNRPILEGSSEGSAIWGGWIWRVPFWHVLTLSIRLSRTRFWVCSSSALLDLSGFGLSGALLFSKAAVCQLEQLPAGSANRRSLARWRFSFASLNEKGTDGFMLQNCMHV